MEESRRDKSEPLADETLESAAGGGYVAEWQIRQMKEEQKRRAEGKFGPQIVILDEYDL